MVHALHLLVNHYLTNLCHREYLKCPLLAQLWARICLRHWHVECYNGIVNNAVPLQPTHQSEVASNHAHVLHFCRRLVAEICPDIVNRTEVMPVE